MLEHNAMVLRVRGRRVTLLLLQEEHITSLHISSRSGTYSALCPEL